MEGTGGRAGGLESVDGNARYSVTENSDKCRMGGGSSSIRTIGDDARHDCLGLCYGVLYTSLRLDSLDCRVDDYTLVISGDVEGCQVVVVWSISNLLGRSSFGRLPNC